MKLAAIILFAVAVALGVFGLWGMFTISGNRTFDEMSGMIPFFALVAAGILAIAGLVFLVISFR